MAKKKSDRESVWPGLASGVPKPLMPYSPAIKAGDWVFIAGTIASDFATGLAPEVKAANPLLENELAVQSRYVLRNLHNTIKASGVDTNNDMVRMWQWFVGDKPTPEQFEANDHWTGLDISPYMHVRKEFVKGTPPPSSYLGVRELLCFGTKIEVDMICLNDGNKNVLIGAPDSIGSSPAGHAAAIKRGDWIFTHAESAVDWKAGALSPAHLGDPGPLAKEAWTNPDLWYESPVEKQTDYVLQKLDKVVKAAGTTLDQAVKADVYIGHPSDFPAMDRVWKKWFPKNPPARVVIPYMGMGARGSRIEIALTLLTKNAKIKKTTITAKDAPKPLGHEPHAVKAGKYLFFSTQMANDSSGNLAAGMIRHPSFPWYNSPGQAQMRYMMKNIAAICEAADTSVDQICRRVCFHSDFQWFAESIEEWARYFPGDKPASTTIRLGGPFVVPGANTLLDLIAYCP